ncbi:MAG: MoxR family ATPase [Candidatus Freyarchaeota archaeon]|nr:MoxR family ATPase [Candidatus Jordarchaeia archaeon]MBS7268137.1 MoxR family ATPase [Candidatus Jordarchaeia archaeon]MBS7278595.1 MoxR family ATPase [Candidatus Jordarchaeia archaeon]
MSEETETETEEKTRKVSGVNAVRKIASEIMSEVNKFIVGKSDILEYIFIALMCDGHVLLEGVPGVAKTYMAKTFAQTLGCSFKRIQFTPDLLPSDILGTYVFDQKSSEFSFREGPVFANIVLADEINRAPPKTQSALLEAMQEKQVTIEGVRHPLPKPFMVLATQNPIEQEGTYPLPEAQIDRFLFKLNVDYPTEEEEVEMLRRRMGTGDDNIKALASPSVLVKMQKVVSNVYVAPEIMEYIRDIVIRTRRNPQVLLGGSPRASIVLMEGAKARAALNGREYVIPDDVKAIAQQSLNHRLILRPEAELEGVSVNRIIASIIGEIQVPV